jgi:hypothetical protein
MVIPVNLIGVGALGIVALGLAACAASGTTGGGIAPSGSIFCDLGFLPVGGPGDQSTGTTVPEGFQLNTANGYQTAQTEANFNETTGSADISVTAAFVVKITNTSSADWTVSSVTVVSYTPSGRLGGAWTDQLEQPIVITPSETWYVGDEFADDPDAVQVSQATYYAASCSATVG